MNARDHDRESRGGRAWQVPLAAGLFLTLLYVAVPYGMAASAVYVAASLFAAAAIALALGRRPQAFEPAAWGLLASALALAAMGHAIWYWLDLRGLEPFPSLADVFYLGVYPLFMAALWRLGRHSGGGGDGAISDALIVGTSAGVLGWALLITPYVNDPGLTLLQLLVSAAYPVADLALLPLVLRLVFLHRARVAAHRFLLAGMLAYLAADVLYAHGNSAGWYRPGGLTDALWLVAYALFSAAAWHPSAREAPVHHASRAELSGRRLVLLGAASVLTPAAILLAAGTDTEVVRVAAFGSILLFLLILHRMAGLMSRAHRQAELLEELSRTDPLTGAANRRRLDEELEREMARAGRAGAPFSVAFLDLDHFKSFNDSRGHSAGDELLQALVNAWREELRAVDVLARIGGEEFVVVFPDTGSAECRVVLERLRQRIPQGQTCSAGVAVYRRGERTADLLDRADRALYDAKHQGRDRVVVAGDGDGSESSKSPAGTHPG